MGKKRKHEAASNAAETSNTSKPTAEFKPQGGRTWTLSIALPGSILANAQSRELQALLAGQIARAAAVFSVDEIVIFNDGDFTSPPNSTNTQNGNIDHDKYTGFTDPNHFLAHVLSYLECPPYLRKRLFPMHPDFQHTGMLPSLDMPHHLKAHTWCEYREGVTVEDPSGRREKDDRSLVETGLKGKVYVQPDMPTPTRVTVRLRPEDKDSDLIDATPVAPSEPREKQGWYWGYSVRLAESLSAVLTECPFDGGYDLTFGTSERGVAVSDVSPEQDVPRFHHMMIVFGGVAGLEVAVKADEELKKLGVEDPQNLFDFWVNLVPGQGSKTIRTEEAVWLGLMALKDVAGLRGRG